MPRPLSLSIALCATLLAGCGRDAGEPNGQRAPQPATLAAVYSGDWPCSNCASIAATLWLRADGAFILRQQFTDDDARDARSPRPGDATYGLGRWHWDEHSAEVVLRGAGPERRFAIVDERRLELQVAAAALHALIRRDDAPAFGDRLTLDGESTVTESGASFRECLTGIVLAVADAGAYRELRRQHRRLNPRGNIALTTLEGHLVAVTDGSTTTEQLIVDRFITIKPGTGC
jgi:hypothetical protein